MKRKSLVGASKFTYLVGQTWQLHCNDALTVRCIAFDIVEAVGIDHRFNKTTKKAGKHWLQGYFSRYRDLPICAPQSTNLSRFMAFNTPISTAVACCSIHASSIWNMDERLGLTMCYNECQKSLPQKGRVSK